jgi:16S rRNA (cytosine1402-N4)-methyltransferase
MENYHRPVLLDEAIEALAVKPDGYYVDLTLGRAGHSGEIAKRLRNGRLFCFDKDITAVEAGREILAPYIDKVTLIKSDFREIKEQLYRLGTDRVDGILMDLGVSSPQLDNAQRGFSYMKDAPLDMRMDESAALSAWDVVNLWEYEELRRILYEYGEERYSPLVANYIIKNRPIASTLQLVQAIISAMPAAALREKQHPAKRTFQAIRIAVNDELGALEAALEAADGVLAPGGRLAVITFHSLEDRIVKRFFSDKAKGCTCPADFPVCVCGKKPDMRIVTKKPVIPSEAEVEANPRSRSAKLRAGEKIGT